TDEELAMWKSRDPIPTFTTYLRTRGVLDDDKLRDIETRVTSTIDAAVEFAMNAPDPSAEDAVTDLYARADVPRSDPRSARRRDAPRSKSVRPRRGRWPVRRGIRCHAGAVRGVRRHARHRYADLRIAHRRRQHRRVAPRLPPRRRDAVRRFHLVRVRSDRESGGDAAVSVRRAGGGGGRRGRATRGGGGGGAGVFHKTPST